MKRPLRARDITTPADVTRIQAVKAAIMVSLLFRGTERTEMLQELGLLPYRRIRRGPKGATVPVVNYRRP